MDTLRDLDLVRAVPPSLATEIRADEGDGNANGMPTMVVRFSVFDTWYEIDSFWEGTFLERTVKGAFKRTIKNNGDQVKVLYDHGMDFQVGNKVLGPIDDLREDPTGPVGEVPLFDTAYNRDLRPGLEAGVYGSSFRFRVLREEWVDEPEASDYNPKGLPERTIKEVRLFEFGPVTFPANPDSTAGLRCLTDQYYERLRSRQPELVDELRARVIDLRTPTPAPAAIGGSDGDGPAALPSDSDPATRHSDDDAAPEPAGDAGTSAPTPEPAAPGTSTPTSTDREARTMDPMTVEERAARQSEIRARLAEIDSEYSGAALPEDIRAEWDELNAEHDEHVAAIADAEARRQRLRALSGDSTRREAGADPGQPAATRRAENIYDLAEIRQHARSVDELPGLYRDHAMRAVEQARFPGVKDRAAAQAQVERLLDSVDDDNGTLARRILVTGSPTYDRAFGKAMTALSTNGLTAEEQRALSLGSDAGGGFAVPFQLDPTVIETSDGQVDPIRQIARVEQITGKEWQGVTSAGITVSRAAEGDEATDNAPTLAQPTVTPTRVQGFVPFSIEIDQDWPAMRSEITTMLGEAKAEEESTAFALGDGTGNNPSGIVATLDSDSHVDAAGEGVAVGDLYAVEEALPPRFRGRARWLANRSIYNKVRQLDTAGGANLWVRLAAGLPPELIGYPAHEASAMDGSINAAATGTNLVLLFGDFSKFLIVDRVGMAVELVPHLFGATRRMPTGQRGIYAIWRNSSKVLADNAFRLLKVTTAA